MHTLRDHSSRGGVHGTPDDVPRAQREDAAVPLDVLDDFSLGRPTSIEALESYGNRNWLVEAEGRRYVLREQTLNSDSRRIELQSAFQEHLRAHGIATPRPIHTASDALASIDARGTPWLLSTYVEGREYDFGRTADATEAGTTLARFHEAASSFRRPGPGPEYKAPLLACWSDPQRDLDQLATMFQGAATRELAQLRDLWRAVLRDWPAERLRSLPSGWLHGDYHGRNVVYRDDRIVGVLDFDDVDIGPYAYDLANALVKFGRERRGSLVLRPAFMRAFLDGYERERPINREERAALPWLGAMAYPPHPQNYAYWQKRGENIVERFGKEVVEIRAYREEISRVSPAVFS